MSDLNNTTALSAPTLKIEMSFTPHLEKGATIMPLSAYVTPIGFDGAKAGPTEIFVGLSGDVSGSMHNPIDPNKSAAGMKDDLMRSGGHAGLDMLTPSMWFALYTIGKGGRRVYGPAQATADNVAKAKKAWGALAATEGDTNMAPCMRLFREDAIALKASNGINVAVMGALTDGGYSDSPMVDRELTEYKSQRAQGLSLTILPCGIGLDWQAPQLQKIAESTMSPETPELVMTAAKVKETFERVVEVGASLSLSNVKLIIKKAASVPLLNVSVQKPVSIDLKDKVVQQDDKTTVINLGAWDNETRLFYLELGVQEPQGASNLTACFMSFQYDLGGKTVTTEVQKVICTWTDDANLSSVLARGVNAAQGINGSKVRLRQAAELAGGGNFEKAEALLSQQYRTAKQAGQEDVIAMLLQHVDVVDEAAGTVRMKNRDAAGAMTMQAKSGESVVRVRGQKA